MRLALLPFLLTAALVGCGGSYESSARDAFAAMRAPNSRTDAMHGGAPHFDGTLARYVEHALRTSPELAAEHARWAASIERIAPTRRLPSFEVSYGFFVQSVETRVGPQRHRVGARQMFPWPTRLTAGSDAAALEARAAEQRFAAKALELERRVTDAYFRLWLVRQMHVYLTEQDVVLDALVEVVRTRVEVNQATLADLAQLELRVERHHDHHAAHREAERIASAALRAVLDVPPETPMPTADERPVVAQVAEDEAALRVAALAHPRLATFESRALAREAGADRAFAEALPSFGVGVDWIETGTAAMAGVQDSGKDPFIVSLMMSVPILSAGTFADAEQAERSEARALRSDADAARANALAELEEAEAMVRDSARRAALYGRTLGPQAESAYVSVLGSYQSGTGSITQVLAAVGDLLDLVVREVQAEAEHASAWARLDQVVGRRVARREAVRETAPEVSDE